MRIELFAILCNRVSLCHLGGEKLLVYGVVERAHRTHTEEFYEVTESSFELSSVFVCPSVLHFGHSELASLKVDNIGMTTGLTYTTEITNSLTQLYYSCSPNHRLL